MNIATASDRARGIVWRPDADTLAAANLSAFLRSTGSADLAALNHRATEDPGWFWHALMTHFSLRFGKPYDAVVDTSQGAPWARWCIGGTTNLVANCLDRHRGTATSAKAAVEWEGEDGSRRAWTYAELDAQVCRLAGALRARGVGPGDVVAIYLPMVPEVAAAFLAIAKVGAIVLPLFSGFGSGAIAARLADAGAKAALTVDAMRRRGAVVPMKPTLDAAAADAPTLEHVIVLRHVGIDVPMRAPRDAWWHDAVAAMPDDAPTTQVPADEPLILIFTSGTTGKAKGAVLTHCGFMAKVALDIGLCMDFKPGDRMLWMTDIGWLVGPILVCAPTLLGGTLVLAEGAPDYPEPHRIWRLLQDFRISFFGVAPTIVRSLMRHGSAALDTLDLSALRIIASTGEPWNPDSWNWLFEHVGRSQLPIINYTGGTEIGGGILTCTVVQPLKPCAFSGPCPGMGADVVDERGAPVGPGEVGELVLRQPSIGLTRGLWHDRERYLEAYWARIPGLWVHGDFASIDADGFWYVHGRSDDTLKIAGKRVGPAEIESVLLATGRLVEAAVIGVPDPVKGQGVVCVCVVRDGGEDLSALRVELSAAVERELGHPFRPQRIVFVADLPKTRNMKIMRRLVRAACIGQATGDLSSLVNPEAVTELQQAFAGPA